MFKDRKGRCHKDNGKFTKCHSGTKKRKKTSRRRKRKARRVS